MAEDSWYSNGNNNWNATNAWNTQADGGGTALSDPDADAHVIIQGNDTITITAAIGNTIKSLTIDSGSDLDGHASHIIETTAEGTASFGSEHYAVKINGTTDSNVNITVGGTFDTRLDLDGTMGNLILKGSGEKEFRGTPTIGGNVTIQDSCDATCAGAVQINGNLTITSGSYDTGSNHALTVAGITNVQGTLTCNASTVSLGSGVTSNYGLIVGNTGTFTGGSGTHTLGSIQGGGGSPGSSITLSSGTTTIDSEMAGDNEIIEVSSGANSWNDGDGTLVITTPAASRLQLNKSGATLNNLTINHANANIDLLTTGLTLTGNLTITAGELDTGSDVALTVAGDITNAGTLDYNASAVSSRKLISTGTLTGADGGVCTVTGAGLGETTRTVDLGGTVSGDVDITLTGAGNNRHEDLQASGNIRNLIVNNAAAVIHTGRDTTLDGNLTITAGTVSTDDSGTSVPLTVSGNTKVTGTLTGNDSTLIFGTNGVHGSVEAGCLWVEAAGSFTFGSGDVTVFGGITAKGTEAAPCITSTGGGDILIKGRTNNGFMNSHSHHGVNITGDYIIDYDTGAIFDNRGGTTIACGTFIIQHDGRTYEPWENSGGSTHALFKIIGNMSITQGTFDTEYSGQNSQNMEVTGTCTIGDGSGSANTAEFKGNSSPSISFGSLVIDSDGKYDATPNTTTITGGFRPADVAGTLTLNGGAWELGGTGGNFEGDFLKNEREVRINQDFALDFPGTDEYISIPDHDDFSFGDGSADSPFSLSAWIYMDADPFPIISKGGYNQGDGEYAFLVSGSGYLALELYDESVSSCYLGKQYQTAIPLGSWAHVAATYDATEASSGIELYVNGVQVTAALYQGNEGSYVAMENLGHTLMIGEAKGPSYANGKISDVRIYDSVLSAANVAKLASKMHVGVGSPIGWWKINEPTIDDNSTANVLDSSVNSHNGTPTGWDNNDAVIASQDYTAFGVDIQDNTTTVNNLIVENGQLNTKALDYLAFDGINDYANTTVALQTEMRSSFSLACWCKITDGVPSANNALFAANNEDGDRVMFYISTGGRLTCYYQAAATDRYIGEADPVTFTEGQNPWRHVIFTMKYNSSSSATMKLYINGADAGAHTGSSDGVFPGDMGDYTSTTTFHIGGANNESSADDMWTTGFIRDFRIYDYDLNADQAASLYRGSYNVTPKYGWKFDDGSGNATGFGTANAGGAATATVNGTSGSATSGFVDDSTLKVNGAARVLTNGSVL